MTDFIHIKLNKMIWDLGKDNNWREENMQIKHSEFQIKHSNKAILSFIGTTEIKNKIKIIIKINK